MKKLFLLLGTAILAGALLIACAQPESPSSLTVTNHIPGTAGVAADKIKAESFDGLILVSWEAGYDAAGYNVWRRELKADGTPDEGTAVLLSGTITRSTQRQIPFYKDNGIKDGVSYQYGVVVNSYKSASGDAVPKSEIVWQAVSPENPAAQGKGRVDTATTVPAEVTRQTIDNVLKNIQATPVTLYDTRAALSGETNLNNKGYTTVSGLTPGYSYAFFVEYVNRSAAATAADWFNYSVKTPISLGSSVPSTYTYDTNFFISNYLDTGDWAYQPVLKFDTGYGDYDSSNIAPGNYANYEGRIVVEVNVPADSGKFITVTPGTESTKNIASNGKALVAIEKE